MGRKPQSWTLSDSRGYLAEISSVGIEWVNRRSVGFLARLPEMLAGFSPKDGIFSCKGLSRETCRPCALRACPLCILQDASGIDLPSGFSGSRPPSAFPEKRFRLFLSRPGPRQVDAKQLFYTPVAVTKKGFSGRFIGYLQRSRHRTGAGTHSSCRNGSLRDSRCPSCPTEWDKKI